MTKILEQTRLLTLLESKKMVQEFMKKDDIIKGNSFDNLLDNIDTYHFKT